MLHTQLYPCSLSNVLVLIIKLNNNIILTKKLSQFHTLTKLLFKKKTENNKMQHRPQQQQRNLFQPTICAVGLLRQSEKEKRIRTVVEEWRSERFKFSDKAKGTPRPQQPLRH